MITDIKGYTQKTSSQSRQKTLDLVLKHTKLVQPIILNFHGTVVKTMGDAFLATFESPTNTLLSAIEIQKQLDDYNDRIEVSQRIKVRIAINSGEEIVSENDVYGEPVNIAARIESLAKPNEIYFTEAVYLSMNRREVPSSEIGYRILKGIPDKIKVYKVLMEHPSIKAPSSPDEKFSEIQVSEFEKAHIKWRFLAATLDIIVMGIIARGLLNQTGMNIFAQAIYFIGFWAWKSATPGKMIVGLKIVDQKTRTKIVFWQAVKRFLGYIVSAIPLGFGFVWILQDKDRQGWHDKIANTLVLKRKNIQNTTKKVLPRETSA